MCAFVCRSKSEYIYLSGMAVVLNTSIMTFLLNFNQIKV